MKESESLIYYFSGVSGLSAVGIALLIRCKENISTVVAVCILAVMSGIILAILLLMKKQILQEKVHNENKFTEFVGKNGS